MEENNKPSYEQLEQVVMELSQKNRELISQATTLRAQLMNINNVTLSLKYMFKVLGNKECFPKEFVDNCAHDIMGIMSSGNQETAETPVEE